MEKTEFKKLLSKAQKAEGKLNTACSNLETFFEPFFPGEISVLYQPSDGFVVLYDIEKSVMCKDADKNEGVREVFENISLNPRHYF